MTVIDNRMEAIVKQILIDNPETRGSDDKLWCEYICRAGYGEYLGAPFGWVVKRATQIGLPKRSSVSRVRRKIQAAHPELKDEKVAAFREEREQAFIEYARS